MVLVAGNFTSYTRGLRPLKILLARLAALVGVLGLGVFAAGSLAASATTSMSFAPTDDTYADSTLPDAVFGSALEGRVDADPPKHAYLRFDVDGLTSPVSRATLRVYSRNAHFLGFEVRSLDSTSWMEETLTYATAPAFSETVVAASGAIALGSWVELDVTPLVAGNGPVAFALTTRSVTQLPLALKESGDALAPQLIVETGTTDTATTTPSDTTTPTDTTPPPDTTPPSVPSGLTVTAMTETTVSVAWRASSDDVGVTGYGVYRESTLLASTAETTFTLTDLTCDSSYSVAVDAYDAANNRSQPSPALTVTTAACPDALAPTVPGNLRAVEATTSTVTVAWDPSTDNVGVTGYGIYREGTLLASSAETTFTLTDLTCESSYSIAVDAYDAAANRSERSPALAVTTAACPDVLPPTVPANLRAVEATTSTVTLAWDPSTDNVGVTGYGVYREGTLLASTAETTLTLTDLTCETSYSVAVDAFDAATNRSEQSPALTVTTGACPDVLAPTVPGNLRAVDATTSTITVAWDASTDNIGVTGYGVYREGTLLASSAETTFTLTDLTCESSYSVAVDAYDAANNRSQPSPALTVTTAACPDVLPPTVPGNLREVEATTSSVRVAWDPSTDNVGVTGYGVYREGTLLASTAETTFTLTDLTCETSYSVVVDAFDAATNRSELSPALTVTTAACPDVHAPTMPGNLHAVEATTSTVTVAWDPSTDNIGVTGYRVYRNGTFVAATQSHTHTFDSLECGLSYEVGVDAFDAAGNVSARATVTASTAACRHDPVIAVAGDIAGNGTGDSATAALLDSLQPTAVLTSGDNAYPDGSLSQYIQYYQPTWGRHKALTFPTPGNHEYGTTRASGYFSYFGARAGPSGKGWYSYDLGDWHLIALNSELDHGPGSEQVSWLKNDLAASSAKCVLAYWHKPRFTAGNYSDHRDFAPFWDVLYAAGADVVVNGHDHNYQRYAPMSPSGVRDNARGIREFVVGTGGRSHYGLRADSRREAADATSYGVLKLTLRPDSYEWAFIPEAGKTYTDNGTGTCH